MEAEADQQRGRSYRKRDADECAAARQPAHLARPDAGAKAKHYGEGVLHHVALSGEKLRRM
jgi:hypothetical protein